MRNIYTLFLVLLSAVSIADTVTVSQKNKLFVVQGNASATEITISKGDVVRFVNDDDFFHNVFSLSDAKLFDLGSFPKGEHRDVTFDESGVVEVECAIHPEMKLNINVE